MGSLSTHRNGGVAGVWRVSHLLKVHVDERHHLAKPFTTFFGKSLIESREARDVLKCTTGFCGLRNIVVLHSVGRGKGKQGWGATQEFRKYSWPHTRMYGSLLRRVPLHCIVGCSVGARTFHYRAPSA